MAKKKIELTPRNIKEELEYSVKELEVIDIKNLSFLELASLREFVSDSIKDYNLHVNAINKSRSPKRKNQLRFYTMFSNIGQEAASRWLYFNYGIGIRDYNDWAVIKDRQNNVVYEGYDREKAIRLFHEKFPVLDIDIRPSKEMTEYVRRLRERSHLI